MFVIEEELKKLPDQPGVYIMHDSRDAIIYIGKAVSLRKRVHQYFQPSHDEGIKKAQMVKQIARFEYIVTDSELEALVLECNLIKEHRPKYNTMLRDDKTYPYIRVTLGEDFPRVLFSRQQKKDKSRYFGPYTSAGAVKDTIELVNKIYQLRTCNRNLPRDTGKDRPCLNYHIHQCTAPCQGYITKEAYRERVDAVVEFLNGNYAPVLKSLEEKMNTASANLEFEKAIEYRELLNSVRQIAQKQKITHTDGEDKDIIALAADDRDAVVQVFFIRDGKLIGRDHFYVKIGTEDTKAQILTTFIKQFYSGTPFIPREIMLPQEIEEQEVLADWLGEKRGSKVYIRVPQKGMKEKLVELAQKNAKMVLAQDREKIKREEGTFSFLIVLLFALSPCKYGIGSTATPNFLTSKCKCGPVEFPVEPTAIITSPCFTVAPSSVYISCPCPYKVTIPSPWFIITQLPYPLITPAYVTIPSAAATTGAPNPAFPMSIPSWYLYTP